MRKLIVWLVAFASLAVPVALAQSVYPEKIALPNGFAPEGIEVGLGKTIESNVSVAGSNRTIAFAPKSVSHTMS